MRTIDADRLNSIKFHPFLYTHITPSDADAESYKRGWNDAIDSIIENAPTIEPERKKGKWISKGYGEYRCSSCRNIVDLDEEILMSIKMFDYCPVCGAYMREDHDGRKVERES